MPQHATPPPSDLSLEEGLEPAAADFYRAVLQVLVAERIPFLVGGAVAHACHTGIRRLDLRVRRAHVRR